MIVMKFGGSSLQSASSLTQVVSIVRSERHRLPIIVASAAGDTTDHLLHLMAEARSGRTLACLRVLDLMRDHHLSICETLLHDYHRESLDGYLQASFRDLHIRTLEVCEGERVLTPELQDSVVSLGEQWSSRLLAEILDEHCSPAIHVDSRKLILTDDHFTEAVPLYPETFANIRWLLPALARQKVVAVGGFIGANSEGRTTTLGRGGSDFTAAIIGAAIHADEVQVWKDVDGMLSCDPRILRGGRPVEQLSYQEATELAEVRSDNPASEDHGAGQAVRDSDPDSKYFLPEQARNPDRCCPLTRLERMPIHSSPEAFYAARDLSDQSSRELRITCSLLRTIQIGGERLIFQRAYSLYSR